MESLLDVNPDNSPLSYVLPVEVRDFQYCQKRSCSLSRNHVRNYKTPLND